MNFTEYIPLNETTAMEYVTQKISFFDPSSKLTCKEIGDGNLNFVYRVMDEVSKKSIIIKQAGAFARSTPEYRLTTDRARIESEILSYQGELTNGSAPKVYLYDEVMCCCIMEDLKDYKILRSELINLQVYPKFAYQIAHFLADTLIRTSDVCMDSSEKKAQVKKFINPELCKISEDLVFTDPYTNFGKTNDIFEPNQKYVEEKIYENAALKQEAAKLSIRFKSSAQSLLHGDLHSGSIFIKENGMKVFDPEFSFYGPAGYDVGNVVGNLAFAWVAAYVLEEQSDAREKFLNWIEKTVVDIIDIFSCRGVELIMSEHKDPLYHSEEFANWYVNQIICDAAGYAGMEMIRRVVGEAHVRDIADLPCDQRVRAERLLVDAAERLVMHRSEVCNGKQFAQMIFPQN